MGHAQFTRSTAEATMALNSQDISKDVPILHYANFVQGVRKNSQFLNNEMTPISELEEGGSNMPAYVTVQLEVIDAETFGEYRKVGGPAVAKHGGKPLSAGNASLLYDAGIGTMPSVLLEFPDADAAQAWINDPELADVHALRNKGGKATITLLQAS